MDYIISAISGLFGLAFFIIYILLVVYSLLNILKNPNFNQNTKLLWIIIILVAPILGSIIYLFWGSTQSFL